MLCMPMVARGDLYQWIDEQGQAHFSDRPPPDAGQVDVITVTSQPVAVAPPVDPLVRSAVIRQLTQHLLQQVNESGDLVSTETRALAQALARRVETAAPDWDTLEALAEALARSLPAQADQQPGSIQETAGLLLEEIKAGALSVPSPSASPAEELERIRTLTATLEADRKARAAEQAALQEKLRQARSLDAYQESQTADLPVSQPQQRYLFVPANPCYRYPGQCVYPQPPVQPPPRPEPPWERPRPPQQPCQRLPQKHRGATGWQVGCPQR